MTVSSLHVDQRDINSPHSPLISLCLFCVCLCLSASVSVCVCVCDLVFTRSGSVPTRDSNSSVSFPVLVRFRSLRLRRSRASYPFRIAEKYDELPHRREVKSKVRQPWVPPCVHVHP